MDDPGPSGTYSLIFNVILSPPASQFGVGTIIVLASMLVLLVCSALISGSEIAFFSLQPSDKLELEGSESPKAETILRLLERPRRLLATILIGNNLVNVAIIILSSLAMTDLFDFSDNEVLGFLIQVVLVTFLILLVGEVIPKVYANRYALRLAGIMAKPISIMEVVFRPLSKILVSATRFIDNRFKKASSNISVDDLSHALELTTDDQTEAGEQKMLEGIVTFGSKDVKQIMTARMDVIALDIESNYEDVIETVRESGFSRLPVFSESFDEIKGMLYIKDLLPHLQTHDYEWKSNLREPFFVPENKKIDDLLREFQEERVHLAIVVDEYGGSSGIVTLEDVIEEIVGDISDEFDDEDVVYTKLDENNYVFEGKTALIDVYRITEWDGKEFEDEKGESDTLAGFVLEIAGRIPQKNERIQFNDYTFLIEAADPRKIKRIKVSYKAS